MVKLACQRSQTWKCLCSLNASCYLIFLFVFFAGEFSFLCCLFFLQKPQEGASQHEESDSDESDDDDDDEDDDDDDNEDEEKDYLDLNVCPAKCNPDIYKAVKTCTCICFFVFVLFFFTVRVK